MSEWVQPSGPWIVQVLDDALPRHGELSLVRTDYALGRQSWGWDDADYKIILKGYTPMSAEKWARWLSMAQTMVDALNKRDADNGNG